MEARILDHVVVRGRTLIVAGGSLYDLAHDAMRDAGNLPCNNSIALELLGARELWFSDSDAPSEPVEAPAATVSDVAGILRGSLVRQWDARRGVLQALPLPRRWQEWADAAGGSNES